MDDSFCVLGASLQNIVSAAGGRGSGHLHESSVKTAEEQTQVLAGCRFATLALLAGDVSDLAG